MTVYSLITEEVDVNALNRSIEFDSRVLGLNPVHPNIVVPLRIVKIRGITLVLVEEEDNAFEKERMVGASSSHTISKLSNERPTKTKIWLSLASHSYIYPLGIAKDVLVDVTGYVYLVNFIVLDIKLGEKRPFILGTPFLTTAKVVIKFDKGTITLRSRKSKISFQRIPELQEEEDNVVNNKEIVESKMEPNNPKGEEPLKKVCMTNEVGRRKDGGLKHTNASVDRESDVNVMPFSTYSKLTNERPTETRIMLSLASHTYIYPLGLVEDVLVDVTGYVYPINFFILDIKEDERRPFILGTPFLTMAKAVIKFDKGMIEKGIKNDIEPIASMMTVNRLVLE
nr:hypothetical protein [Tanacetum cinerariifolium]